MALGRGLDSLIPQKRPTPTMPSAAKPDETVSGERIVQLPLTQIGVNPHQPRQEFNRAALEELVASIREHGIIQPLIVTRRGDEYELIAGERRLRAAQTLEFPTVPVIVREASEAQKLELAIIENVQRRDLNPIEEAVAYQRLIDEFSLTQEEVGKRVGKSRAAISNMLRLLLLPAEVQEAIQTGKISEGHAKVLAGLDTVSQQMDFFDKIVKESLTVRQLEAATSAVKGRSTKQAATIDPTLLAQEEQLRTAFGTKVAIEKKKDKGRIMIEFYSDEELQDLIGKLIRGL